MCHVRNEFGENNANRLSPFQASFIVEFMHSLAKGIVQQCERVVPLHLQAARELTFHQIEGFAE